MAMVTCPSCKKIVSVTSGKCPNCGGSCRVGRDNGTGGNKNVRMISSGLMIVSCILLFIDFFGLAKTYVGGMLLGVGLTMQGLANAKRDKEDGEKSKAPLIIVIGLIFFLIGVWFFYMDITV